MNAVAAAGAAHQTGESVIFWVLAIVSVAAALGMIFMRKAVYSALLLAVVMLSLAVFYAVNDAPFLAFVQVIVYTGAVLMLFLFVVMLVGVSSTESMVETIRGQRVAAAVAGIGVRRAADRSGSATRRCRPPRAWSKANARAATSWAWPS